MQSQTILCKNTKGEWETNFQIILDTIPLTWGEADFRLMQ